MSNPSNSWDEIWAFYVAFDMREIVISDIHGCAMTFRALVEKQVQLTRSDHLYLLGDYIDRGPDSKGVIDYILRLRKEGFQVSCLRGNHEDLMLQAGGGAQQLELWLYNGGDVCLESYNLMVDASGIPEAHWKFVQNLELYHQTPDHFLVHAGLNFEVLNPLKDHQSMMWIRDWYDEVDWDWLENRLVVHGHTPQQRIQIEKSLEHLEEFPIINIDAGCFCYGWLCALDISNYRLHFQECIDEVRWP